MRAYPRSLSHFAAAIVALGLLGLLSGCGNGLAEVSGVVTLDGQPLRGGQGVVATVMFQPVSGSGSPGVGNVDPDGRYKLFTGVRPGAAPGEYVVTCSATQVIPSNDGGAASGKALTDPKYASAQTSGLACSVRPGDNTFDIALESAKKGTASRR